MKYSTHYNYIVGDRDYEPKSNKPSLTIPGQTYTVKQILEYSKKGIKMPLLKQAIFEESDFPGGNPMRQQNMDLTDVDNLKKSIDETMKKIDKVRKAKEQKKRLEEEAKKEAEIIQRYEASKSKKPKDVE